MFNYLGRMSSIGVDRKILVVVGFQIIFHIWQQLWSERPLDYVKKQFAKASVSRRDSSSDVSKWCAVFPYCSWPPLSWVRVRSYCPTAWRHSANTRGGLWALRNLDFMRCVVGWKKLSVYLYHTLDRNLTWMSGNSQTGGPLITKFLLPSSSWLY